MFSPLLPIASASGGCSSATCAAIKCLLAYTHGLEHCRIDVEIVDGVIVLTGMASSYGAARDACVIAADFSSTRVVCDLLVDPDARNG